MKLLSIAIPSYNSQDYMRNCIDSLLTGGEEVEILIIDDGSKDATPQIADEYAKKYPSIIRAIHRRTAVMERRSTPASAMPQDFSTRWWTVMTG